MARLPISDFYQPGAYCAEDSVAYLMKRVLASFIQQAELRLEPHDLTHAQWQPLFKLRQGKSMPVAEMARELQMDTGAMTRLLDRLEKKGLCKRVRSTEDRRVVNVELTPDGEAAAQLVPGVLSEVLNAHLAGFSKTEWQALMGYLRRMLDNGEALRRGHTVGPDKRLLVMDMAADEPSKAGGEGNA
jgi:DNA-binding MarR family transcriptional regulator